MEKSYACKVNQNSSKEWTKDLNWTYGRRSYNVLDVILMSYVRSASAFCPKVLSGTFVDSFRKHCPILLNFHFLWNWYRNFVKTFPVQPFWLKIYNHFFKKININSWSLIVCLVKKVLGECWPFWQISFSLPTLFPMKFCQHFSGG